ncbi:ROK family glucokinase [Agilicoccus flavus]|uniref:ROK family glucokinase n=1 Tax=Agilicoccus flavus TaxID=2775968 RepID=UPI001CF64714|nr:ROK family glucokinase [Agilicoccus flavus]
MTATIGIDIGGTKIAAAVVDEHGAIVEKTRTPTTASDPDAIIEATAELARELGSRHEVSAVGVACAAFIDRERSTIRFAPNISWRDTPVKKLLEDRIEMPVVIENDANAAAWGEFLYGPAHDRDDMVLITVGTGVGGGVVIDGQLLRGAFGIGAELGHVRMVPDGLLCGCGSRGCLEQYASGNALVREARELVRSSPTMARELVRRCGGDAEKLTGPDVTEAALAGDEPAVELLATLGGWIGQGAVSITAVLDPSMYVIGGGVVTAGDLLLEPASRAYHRGLGGRGFRPEATWALASLGNDAGVIGAAALARDGNA